MKDHNIASSTVSICESNILKTFYRICFFYSMLFSLSQKGNVQSLSSAEIKTLSSRSGSTQNSTKFRKYDHESDFRQLLSICKNVYDGTDYLPKRAEEFASNPEGEFKVSQCLDSRKIDCLGNTRKLVEGYWFLEAIRTREEARGHGLATQMTQHLLETARNRGASVMLSATTDANLAMQRIFERVGMDIIGAFPCCSFSKLREIQEQDEIAGGPRQSMIEALGLSSFFEEGDYEKAAQSFSELTSIQEVKESLSKLGGLKSFSVPDTAYIPILYGAIPAELAKTYEEGMEVYKSNSPEAIVIFSRDPSITSLRSDLVCTIIAQNEEALKHALAFSVTKHSRFALVFDPSVPRHCEIYSFLPMLESLCLISEQQLS